VAREAEVFFFFGQGCQESLALELTWLRKPRNLGRGLVCQALPGHIFLVSLAKNPESPAWPGFARLAGLAVVKIVEMIYVSGIQQEFQLTYSVSETVIVQCVYSLI